MLVFLKDGRMGSVLFLMCRLPVCLAFNGWSKICGVLVFALV